MPAKNLETDIIISKVEAEFSSVGLFYRYARGRIKGFTDRQVMTTTGALALIILVGPFWGILATAIALLGEFVELYCLRRWLDRLDRGADIRAILRYSTRAAGFQALTISICVSIAWFTPENRETVFFCLAYLAAAAMNAGFVLSLHRSATLVRMWVYLATGAICLLTDVLAINGITPHSAFDFIGAVMLAYMVSVFVGSSRKNFKRHRASARDLLRRQKIFELGAIELGEKQKELRMLSRVARHASDAIVLSDADAKITWVNDAFQSMTGYSAEEAVGRSPGELLNSPKTDLKTIEALRQSADARQPFRGEILNKRKDGQEIWVETNVVPVLDDQGAIEVFVAVERDITQAKAHAVELAEARSAAERGDRAKSEFLATMSHEIRTPMNGIIGMADLLCESELHGDQRLYAKTIRSSAQALLKIINDILDFSKLDAGKFTLDPIDFSIGECVLEVTDLLKPHAKSKRLNLDVEFSTKLPATLNGDDGRVRQVLINLLGNAIKFTDEGGVTIFVRHVEQDGFVLVTIDIEDTGIGIDPSKIDGIFEHFSQEDAATTRRFGGTGLGLSVSQLLAQQMGGGISVQSVKGRGSVFTFEFRLGFANQSGEQPPVNLPKPETVLAQGLRILVVEDNRTNQILIEKYLAKLPLDVTCVENGALAVEAVTSREFDIVLMDMSMPVMDGLEASKRIRKSIARPLQILALTANAYASDKDACFAAGMNDFLSKPVKRSELLAALASAQARLQAALELKNSA
ncbi:ATP-binding protein [Roseobacteraceae bacterium S113]